MPRIFDNLTDETRLILALTKVLEEANRLDACVGYFNLRGWGALADAVEKMPGSRDQPPCRVLVGMHRPSEEDELRELFRFQEAQTVDQARVKLLKERMADSFRRQLTVGPPTNEQEAALRRLRAQIMAGKVRFKLYLRHPLHAKLYLAHRADVAAPVVGFVGSSNLTFSGLQNQGELNVDVVEQDAAAKLQRWFDDRWDDRLCLDISDELAEIIEESWARDELVDPYLVYLKMAYHLSRDARAGLSEFRIPADFGAELFDFQQAAVKIAAHHLQKHGGVLIGDVVGLGKTLMATALARVFQEDHGTETLIICPKNLEEMWKEYAHRHRIVGKVLPISRAIRELPDERRHRVVLIDESHNLRNPEGRTYRAIQDYVARNESRCILLSATPYNKTFLDLGAQLGLFVGADDPIGIRPETYIGAIGEPQFGARHQCDPRTLKAFGFSDFPDDWRRLMRRYMVRRTRSFIIDNYAQTDDGFTPARKYLQVGDGRRFYFPVRVPRNVEFAFDPDGDDPYPRMFSPDVVERIDTLALPRYGLAGYIAQPLPKTLTSKEKERLENLSRAGVRLKGFCRTNLFKRLESGGPAFLQSVERHILRNHVFLYAIEHGLPLPIGAQDEKLFDSRIFDRDADATQAGLDDLLGEDTADETEVPASSARWSEDRWRAAAQEVYDTYEFDREDVRWIQSAYFTADLARDLRADIDALQSILDECGDWDPDRDAKLAALIDLIQIRHPCEKVLVFTQFADTVDYLDRELKRRGVRDIEGVSAAAKNPAELAWRFSPVSNGQQDLARRSGELRALVATDVLSEGQNLQDCRIIVNYDLPWAIIRLIQRAGRVDRIGQEAEEILCYSFLPAEGLEEIINLRGRLRTRLRENGEVVGSDEAFFEDDPDDRAVVDLYSEKAGILDDGEDGLGVDPVSEAYQVWKNATDSDPDLRRTVERLPDVVYTSKRWSPTPGRPPGVLVYVRDGEGNDELQWVAEDGRIVTDQPIEVLHAASCDPETPALERADTHHALVAKAIADLLAAEHAGGLGGQLGRPSGARYRIYHRIKEHVDALRSRPATRPMFGADLQPAADPDALGRALQDIYLRPLTNLATDSLNRMLKSGASDDELARRVTGLRDDGQLTIPENETADREPQIVCSMGLQQVG